MPDYKKKSALFLASQGVTLFGSSVVQFAIIWYVTLQTSSGAWVSVMTVAAYLPQFIISFFSGAWADRYPRKKLIIAADSFIAAATLLLAVLLPYIGEGTPVLIALTVISVLRSAGTGVQTPAVNAAVTQLVPEDKLMKFNGINSTLQSLVQFAAPAAAGAVLTFGSLGAALIIDILTAAVGIGILSAVKLPFVRQEASAPMLSEIKAGFVYAVKNRFIRRLLAVYGIFIFLCVPAGFLATLFVSRYYGDTYWYMTLVEVIGFIGMTAGGIIIGASGGFKNRMKTFTLGMLAFGILGTVMGIVRSFPVYLVLMAIYGIALTAVQTASTTLLQENSEPAMLGRVFGLFGAMYSGFLPLGMAVFGPLADVMSLRWLMTGSGVLLCVIALFVMFEAGRKRFTPAENKAENE